MYYLSIFLIIFSISLYSQTNCTNAINLNQNGFSFNSTNCNNSNNYIGINGCAPITSSFNPYGGQDIWYKLTPTELITMHFIYNNLGNPNGQLTYPQLYVFRDCPLNGECILASPPGVGGSFILELSPNITYYFILDAIQYTFINSGNCYNFSFTGIPINIPINQDCGNIDVSQGNFNGWVGTTGRVVTSPVGSLTPTYLANSVGIVNDRHTIMTSGNDPCSAQPRVRPTSTRSIRLGNQLTGSQGERLYYRFMVNVNNANLRYYYSVVLEDPSHDQRDQPFFSAVVHDQNNNELECSKFIVSANVNLPGFLNSPTCVSVRYKPWTMVNIDLSAYIGQYVTLSFTTGDCSHSGHFGYAYIDVECLPVQLPISPIEYCGDEMITIQAPQGYQTYIWQPMNFNGQQITFQANLYNEITLNLIYENGCSESKIFQLEVEPCCVDNLNIHEN